MTRRMRMQGRWLSPQPVSSVSGWSGKNLPHWPTWLNTPPADVLAAHPSFSIDFLIPFGAAVTGVDIRLPLGSDTVSYLEAVMAVHGLVVFRGQAANCGGAVNGLQQVRAVAQFGSGRVVSTHAVHPMATEEHGGHEAVFRLSNDPEHGYTENGRGWHHDGLHLSSMFSHISYHLLAVPKLGQTCFAHTGSVFDSLSAAQVEQCASLASVNSHSGEIKPVLFQHPVSGRLSVVAAFGQIAAVMRPKPKAAASSSSAGLTGAEGMELLEEGEADEILSSIYDVMDTEDEYYSHQWLPGDVIFTDNLAVAHKTGAGAHDGSPANGLRIMHRATIEGAYNLTPQPMLPFAPWLRGPETADGQRNLVANPFLSSSPEGMWKPGNAGQSDATISPQFRLTKIRRAKL